MYEHEFVDNYFRFVSLINCERVKRITMMKRNSFSRSMRLVTINQTFYGTLLYFDSLASRWLTIDVILHPVVMLSNGTYD